MGLVTANFAVSLDGYTAGPSQDLEHPFGLGADPLTAWMMTADQPGREADRDMLARVHAGTGAHIMGRNMFGPGRDDWDETWTGWWGPNPPYHAPVFVLTHHPREPVEMEGGTTFTFVTDGIESALDQAKAAAGDRDVEIAGRGVRRRPIPAGRTAGRARAARRPGHPRRRGQPLGRRGRRCARANRDHRLPNRHPPSLSNRPLGSSSGQSGPSRRARRRPARIARLPPCWT